MEIKVSIIISTYNTGHYIRECLNSIACQTLKEIEVIIVDDGSTDNTKSIIDKEYKILNNLIYIYQQNKGAGLARNKGIDISNGEYLLFMDPDDKYPYKDSVERLYMAAIENNAKICGGNIIEWDGCKTYNVYKAGMCDSRHTKNGFIKTDNYYYLYGHTRYIYKSDLIKKNSVAFLKYRRFEDQVFVIKALALAGELFELDYPVYWYRNDRIKDFPVEIWIDYYKGYRDTIRALIDLNLKLMFMKNVPNLLCSLVGKYRYYNFMNIKEFADVSLSIDNIITESNWIDKRLVDYFEIADKIDCFIRSVQKDKTLIIYGAGKNTEKLLNIYDEIIGHNIIGIAVSDISRITNDSLFNHTIKPINSYDDYKDDALVIITPGEKYRYDIEEMLRIKEYKTYYWIDVRLLA